MKKIFILVICIFLSNCADRNKTFWCGDRPCANKKEQRSYFKKTMIVEVREISKKKLKEYSEVEKMSSQAKKNEKKNISDDSYSKEINKIDEKARKKAEKKLLKQKKIEAKKQKKIEADLAKQIKKQEKINLKKKKQITKIENIDNNQVSKPIVNIDMNNTTADDFNKIVENIQKKNANKSYPDINDIPN